MNDEVQRLVRSTASGLSRKWRIERDDIEQELYLWILRKLDVTFFEDDTIDEEEFERKIRHFKSSIRWEGERFCRREKAAREGYSPEDEYFYGTKYLQELLVIYLHTGIEAHPPRTRADSVTRTTDPSEGGGHLASMMDVGKALAKVPETWDKPYRSRLEIRFGPLADLSDDAVAGLSQSEIRDLTGRHVDTFFRIMGTTGHQVRHRTDTALKALQKGLGGSNPWTRQVA